MGKYCEASDDCTDEGYQYERNFYLCKIANELAEANRLKRLELRESRKVIGHTNEGGAILSIETNELEDKAQ